MKQNSSPELAIATTQTGAVEISPQRREPSAIEMIQSVIERGVTSENVAALRELVALKKDMDSDASRKAFARDFIALQKELPAVKATKMIPNRDGSMRSSFAPFDEIDAQLRPLAMKHGFTYSFSEGTFQQSKVTKVCTVMHQEGHERSNPFSVRIGSGPPGCSEAQADGAAHSYAKRGALCDAFNIIVHGIDNDARLEGAPVSKEVAFELERRVKETNSNVAAFLHLAGAATFAEIPEAKYSILDQLLAKKERRQ
ncbi:MAG: ERF family protein [Solirubrobacterales bacterium]